MGIKLPDPITVIDDHIEITLTPREEKLLTILIDNQGTVVFYEEIAHWMWGVTEERAYAAQLVRHICKRVRDKIGLERIETARGRGYIYL